MCVFTIRSLRIRCLSSHSFLFRNCRVVSILHDPLTSSNAIRFYVTCTTITLPLFYQNSRLWSIVSRQKRSRCILGVPQINHEHTRQLTSALVSTIYRTGRAGALRFRKSGLRTGLPLKLRHGWAGAKTGNVNAPQCNARLHCQVRPLCN